MCQNYSLATHHYKEHLLSLFLTVPFNQTTNTLTKTIFALLSWKPFGLIIQKTSTEQNKSEKSYIFHLKTMLLNMSTTKTYKLHNHIRTERVSQPAHALNKSPSLLDINNHLSEAGPLQVAVRTYSGVVAYRPPSPPHRERLVLPSDLVGPAMGPDHMRLPIHLAERSYGSQDDDMENDRSREVKTLLMNRVAPCLPKSNFFDSTRILAHPRPSQYCLYIKYDLYHIVSFKNTIS